MNAQNDSHLVRACRDGDPDAFEGLLKKYERPIFNAAYRIVGDYEEARGITQSVFVKAYQHLSTYDTERQFYSWIYRIAVNESINRLKKLRRFDSLDRDWQSNEKSPEDDFGDTELSRHVQQALMTITPDHRLVIVLRHFMDCSYRDIGEIAGISEQTVKSRLYTARQQLKSALSTKGIHR